MIKIFQGFVISLIKFLQDFVISPTHFSYHNLTNFRKENLEITKICSDSGDKPCLQETVVALARGLKKLPSPYRVKIIRTFQIKSNPD